VVVVVVVPSSSFRFDFSAHIFGLEDMLDGWYSSDTLILLECNIILVSPSSTL